MSDPRVDVTNALARFFDAVDGGDWGRVEEAMTSPVHLDYASFGGDPAADLAPAAVVAQWRGILPGFDHTHHQLGNLAVEVGGDEAQVEAYVTATHGLDGELWTVRGRYAITLAFVDRVWRIRRLRFLVRDVVGDAALAAEAARRASAERVL